MTAASTAQTSNSNEEFAPDEPGTMDKNRRPRFMARIGGLQVQGAILTDEAFTTSELAGLAGRMEMRSRAASLTTTSSTRSPMSSEATYPLPLLRLIPADALCWRRS